jgi:hypothetical protein
VPFAIMGRTACSRDPVAYLGQTPDLWLAGRQGAVSGERIGGKPVVPRDNVGK